MDKNIIIAIDSVVKNLTKAGAHPKNEVRSLLFGLVVFTNNRAVWRAGDKIVNGDYLDTTEGKLRLVNDLKKLTLPEV